MSNSVPEPPTRNDTPETTRTYRYSVYGLTMDSCLACPELIATTGPNDVTVRYGTVPENLDQVERDGGYFQVSAGALLFIVPAVARYLIREGKEITIERAPEASDEVVRLYLLGSGLGAILHQRGEMILHGSGVVVAGKVTIFMGHSGMGKSTLAAAFRRLGHVVVSDDVCVLKDGPDGLPSIVPGPPRLKLLEDACIQFGVPLEPLRRVLASDRKYAYPLAQNYSVERSVPLGELFVLQPSPGVDIAITPLQGAAKLNALIEHTYRREYLEGPTASAAHFTRCAELARRFPVHLVERPTDAFVAELLAERIREHIATTRAG